MSQWNSGFIAEVKQHGGLYIDRVATVKQADNASVRQRSHTKGYYPQLYHCYAHVTPRQSRATSAIGPPSNKANKGCN